MERPIGIEPTPEPWQAGSNPLELVAFLTLATDACYPAVKVEVLGHHG